MMFLIPFMLFLIPLLIILLCLLPVIVDDSDSDRGKDERDKKIAKIKKEIDLLDSEIGEAIEKLKAKEGRKHGVTIDEFDDNMLRNMDKYRGLCIIFEMLKTER